MLRALLAGRPAPWLAGRLPLPGPRNPGGTPSGSLSAAMTEKAALPAPMQRLAAERLRRFQSLRVTAAIQAAEVQKHGPGGLASR
jgi:hypothetical protein